MIDAYEHKVLADTLNLLTERCKHYCIMGWLPLKLLRTHSKIFRF